MELKYIRWMGAYINRGMFDVCNSIRYELSHAASEKEVACEHLWPGNNTHVKSYTNNIRIGLIVPIELILVNYKGDVCSRYADDGIHLVAKRFNNPLLKHRESWLKISSNRKYSNIIIVFSNSCYSSELVQRVQSCCSLNVLVAEGKEYTTEDGYGGCHILM